jgi:HK97 family phage portal protein
VTVLVGPWGEPVEIAPGRGDLRYSSVPYGFPRANKNTSLIGRRLVSYAELFATQPWVAAAVMRMLTWSVRVPLKCYRRKSDDSRERLLAKDHPLARLIQRPWMASDGGAVANQARFIQAMLGPLLVHGNTVIEVEKVAGEDWLKPWDWRNVSPLGPQSGYELVGWHYEEEGVEGRNVSTDKVIHVAWWSPMGPLGVSPLEQLGTTVKIEDAAQRYQASMFQHGARPPSAITASEEFLTLESHDRQTLIDNLRQDVDEIYAGPDQAGKPAVLPPGLDWKQVGHSAVEAELVSQRQITREEIAAVYQIPPPMLGILDHATYSNIETQKEMIYSDAVGPPLVLIEQQLTAMLARDRYGEDDVYVEFDFGPVLRGDRQKEIEAFRAGIASGIYSPNEARRGLNLEPSDEEDADKLWMPTNNLTPMGEKPEEEQPQGQLPEGEQRPALPAGQQRQPQPTGAISAGFYDKSQPRDRKGRFGKKHVPRLPDVQEPEFAESSPDLGHVRTEKDDQVLGVGVVDTVEKHTRVADRGIREYTPERTALHREIVNKLLAGEVKGQFGGHPPAENQENPEVLYTAGGPASGKSSLVKGKPPLVPQPESYCHLDQDFVKSQLPEYRELAGLDENGDPIPGVDPDGYASDSVHREAAHINQMAYEEAMRRGMNIVAEGTGDSGTAQFARRLTHAHQKGYNVRVMYATIPTAEAEERAKKRAEETGRAVPLAGLRSMHANVSRHFPEVESLVSAGIVSEVSLWSTSGPKGTPPQFIERVEGGVREVGNHELLNAFLAKANENPGTLIEQPSFV